MAIRTRSMLFAVSVAILCSGLVVVAARAHPPWDPYDETRFAPVTSFGPSVGIELVATGQNDADGNPVPGTPLLTAPLKAVPAPGLPGYIFVVDQVGRLWAVKLSDGARTLYLDVSARLVTLGVCGPNTFDERGLLGVAFHPDFQRPGKFGYKKFYTYTSEPVDGSPTTPSPTVPTTEADHQNVIAEWQANDPQSPAAGADPASRRELVRLDWPQFNHNGGDMAFGPDDGKLYFSTGDGGGADDADGQPFVTAPPRRTPCGSLLIFGHQNDGNGQKLNTPLGKIHRIDVNPPFTPGKAYRVPSDNPFVGMTTVPEIWALGFRNPWRFSFDKNKNAGELYVGDVGQNDIEEVDTVKEGGNYGWNCKEGTLFFYINGSVPDDGFADPSPNRPERRGDCASERRPLRDPIAQHDTHHEGHSVVGGFVYSGKGVSALRGKYVFGDFSLLFKFPNGPHDYGRLFTFNASGEQRSRSKLRAISELLVLPGGSISLAVLGMGEDAHGEIYVTGNVSGLPFGNNGKVVRIVPAPEADDKDHDD